MQCGRNVFDEVENMVEVSANFAIDFKKDLTEFIDSLPSPAQLMQLAGDFIKEKLLSDDGLCLSPSCPGIHINSGVEEDLVPDLDDLEILASHHITHAYCTRNGLNSRPHARRPNISHALSQPLVSRPVWSNVAGAHHTVRLLQDI